MRSRCVCVYFNMVFVYIFRQIRMFNFLYVEQDNVLGTYKACILISSIIMSEYVKFIINYFN